MSLYPGVLRATRGSSESQPAFHGFGLWPSRNGTPRRWTGIFSACISKPPFQQTHKSPPWSPGEASLPCSVRKHRFPPSLPRSLAFPDFASEGGGWAQGTCISGKFPDGAEAVGPGNHSSEELADGCPTRSGEAEDTCAPHGP